jgi:hypothetical protein
VPPHWSEVEGVVTVESGTESVVLTVQGRPVALLQRLASLPVEEITWQPARLEDHFYAFYEGTR